MSAVRFVIRGSGVQIPQAAPLQTTENTGVSATNQEKLSDPRQLNLLKICYGNKTARKTALSQSCGVIQNVGAGVRQPDPHGFRLLLMRHSIANCGRRTTSKNGAMRRDRKTVARPLSRQNFSGSVASRTLWQIVISISRLSHWQASAAGKPTPACAHLRPHRCLCIQSAAIGG